MSTLNVSNITDGTDTVGTSYVLNGSAKVWVNLNGTGTVAIRDSFNTSSITDQGTGQYNISFTSSMANDDFTTTGWNNAATPVTDFRSSNYAAMGVGYSSMSGQTTSGTSAGSYVASVGFNDSSLCWAVVHGDLA